jgi:hypothetical protein
MEKSITLLELCDKLNIHLSNKLTKTTLDQLDINEFKILFDNIFVLYKNKFPKNNSIILKIDNIDQILIDRLNSAKILNDYELTIILHLIYFQIDFFKDILCMSEINTKPQSKPQPKPVSEIMPDPIPIPNPIPPLKSDELIICDLYSITHGINAQSKPTIKTINKAESKKYINIWNDICNLIKSIYDEFKNIKIIHRCAEFHIKFVELIDKLEIINNKDRFKLELDKIDALFINVYNYINSILDISNISDVKMEPSVKNLELIDNFKKKLKKINTILLKNTNKQIGGSSDNINFHKYVYKLYKYLYMITNA